MKKYTMKNLMSSWSKRSAAIGSMLALAFFAACSDDVTDNDPVTTQGYENEDAFPKCDADYEGYFATLLSTQDVYICSAKNWVNISKSGSGSNAGTSSKTSCTAEELVDGTGVEITCNGKKSVLQYGKQGAEGDPGKAGSRGSNGSDGGPGGKGYDGADAVPDSDRCFVQYQAGDVVLFECDSSTFVRDLHGFLGSERYAWDPLLRTNYVTGYYSSTPSTLYNDQFEGKASGTLVRWEGDDAWVSPTTWEKNVDFRKNMAVAGTATVSVTENIEVTAQKYRPFVGVEFAISQYSNSLANVAAGGGFCLTYSSEKDMALLLKGDSSHVGYLKATIPATENKKKAVLNILVDEFEPVADSIDVKAVLGNIEAIYIEAVGGDTVGEYTNEFALYQFGHNGGCNGYTFDDYKAYLDSICNPADSLEDNRTDPVTKYAAVTIGNQTWMAENMRYNTSSDPCLISGDDADCSQYGRRYTWAVATADLCPSGWHLPTRAEWEELVATIHGDYLRNHNHAYDIYYVDMLTSFKAGGSLTDSTGMENITGLGLVYYTSYYWTQNSSTSTYAYGFYMYGQTNTYAYLGSAGGTTSKTNTYPVRCIKNAE